jgi:predicted permease
MSTASPAFSRRVAAALIRVAARLVPRRYRPRWREEWLGEIDAAPPSAALVIRALGALPDAALTRRTTTTRPGSVRSGAGRRGIGSDLKFGFRMVRRSPGFTLAAVASLSVGIAASTAVFSAINAVLWRTLPGVHESTRLAHVYTRALGAAGAAHEDEYARMKASLTAFSDLAAFAQVPVAVDVARNPFTATAVFVSANYFEVLGAAPSAGRLLNQTAAGHQTLVVSHGFAIRHFGSAADALGRAISVNGRPLQVLGVAAPQFGGVQPGVFGDDGRRRPELWIPDALQDELWPATTGLWNRSGRGRAWKDVIGRLAPAASLATAQQQAAALVLHRTNTPVSVIVRPIGMGPADEPSDVAMAVGLVLCIPLIVLAIGCANTANLQLARAAHRQAELAVRLSLGATRTGIVRQMLIESLITAALAGAVGVGGALALVRVFGGMMPMPMPLDWRVLCFALAATTATGLGFGIAPAIAATRGDLTSPLKDSTASLSYRRSFIRSSLVVVQIALSLLLLVLAGLFTRTLDRLQGLERERGLSQVAAATLDLGLLHYSPEQGQMLQNALLSRVEQIPGVTSAAIAHFAPFSGTSGVNYRRPEEPGGRGAGRYTNGGGMLGRFAETAGIRIVAGRDFTAAERQGPPRAALVSESLARRMSETGDVLGRSFVVRDGDSTPSEVTIVGITAEVMHRLGARETHAMLLPSPLAYDPVFTIWIRTAGDPRVALPHLRSIVRQLDPRVPILDIGAAEDWRDREIGPFRWIAVGLGSMGTLALCLAAAGLYAVMSYLVARRRQEMGIRIALGASPRQLLTLIVGEGLRLTVKGVVAGLCLGAVAASLARALLVGTSPFDPIAFGLVALLLVGVALAATLVPALRASRLDPIATLRRQ